MMYELFSLLFLASFICLIIGLIKPALFSKFIKGDITKKKIALIFGSATVVLFVLVGATAPKINVEQKTQSAISDQAGQVEETTPTTETAPKATPGATTTPQKTTKATTPTPTTPTITPTPTPTPVSSQTISQKNAVKAAKSYLDYTAFSHDGLVAQLEYAKFSHADAVYGADNSGANWNEQATKAAKSYLDYTAFSHDGLVAQLEYAKFTQAQAEYGANAVGL